MTAPWQTLYVGIVILVTIVVLIRGVLPPAGAIFCAMVAALAAGILTPTEAIAGFSNSAPLTVAGLCVMARAVEKTGVLTPIVATTLGRRPSLRTSLLRLLVPVAIASGFLNNTPIVAMMVPEIERWAARQGRSPSDYLMPLSFAAILGGALTIMGTATHIIVSGLISSFGLAPLGFFEISRIGIPIALCGLVAIVLLSPWLLPSRRTPREKAEQGARDFVIDMLIAPGGPLDGKDVAAGGLRQLENLFLIEIERQDGHLIAPVRPETILRGNDRLRFVGRVDDVVQLHHVRGLISAEHKVVLDLADKHVAHFEAVVGPVSPLVGKTLKESAFRSRYGAAVLAVHRAGQRIDAKLGEVRLRVGDTLLLVSAANFQQNWREQRDFLLVSRFGVVPRRSPQRAGLVIALLIALVVAAATQTLPLVSAVLISVALLMITRVLSVGETRRAVNLDVVVTIAAALGLAKAMAKSGLAGLIAHGFVRLFSPWGPRGLLLGVISATALLKELITNNAAAMLILPVALSSAEQMQLNLRGFAIAVSIAACTSFLAPIGYQTNVMVYGPGGYHFSDYARLGAPLTLVVITLLVTGVPYLWPF